MYNIFFRTMRMAKFYSQHRIVAAHDDFFKVNEMKITENEIKYNLCANAHTRHTIRA